MKVYTHYYKLSDNEGLRWRTLLQFGNSFEIIGSVVMKNPGSSKPKGSKEIEDKLHLSSLSMFDDTKDPWYEFTTDDTMRKVAVLFASYYGYNNVNKLNGVIQIFNLFYIMDPNEQRAEQKMKNAGLPANFHTPQDLLNYDIEKLQAPVYLGFGDLAFTDRFRDSAIRYFKSVINSEKRPAYLNVNFEENSFYHPQYLCGNGCNNNTSIYIRSKFKASPLTDEQINNGVPLPKLKLSKEERLSLIHDLSECYPSHGLDAFQYNPKDFKTIRFCMPCGLQCTVTAIGEGYIGIRHMETPKGFSYCKDNYEDKEWLDYLVLGELGFERNANSSFWIGVKSLDYFTDANAIIQFIEDLNGHQLFSQNPLQRQAFLQDIKAHNRTSENQ